MTDAQNTPDQRESRELTLKDVIDRIDALSNEVKTLSTNVNTFDEKFKNYQQATQWVVQLAFTLIASGTVTVIITSVVNK